MIPMKAISFLFLLLMLCPARAEQNRYDVLVRVLDPLLAPFVRQTPNPNRSMDADLSLVAMTGVPQQFIGTTIHLAVQNPDKILLHGPLLGEELTFCRNQKDVWVSPREKAESLLNQLGGVSSESKEKFRLGNLELPFTQAQLIFLPALFQVKEYAAEQVKGVSCRILELNLLPEIARSMGAENWLARLWVGPDYKIAKLEVLQAQWHIVVDVEKIAFTPTLPKSTWQPAPGEAVMHLKDARLKALVEALGRGLGGTGK